MRPDRARTTDPTTTELRERLTGAQRELVERAAAQLWEQVVAVGSGVLADLVSGPEEGRAQHGEDDLDLVAGERARRVGARRPHRARGSYPVTVSPTLRAHRGDALSIHCGRGLLGREVA